jgi:hypothetical protein
MAALARLGAQTPASPASSRRAAKAPNPLLLGEAITIPPPIPLLSGNPAS